MVMVVGHRGARNLWPENSLEGFRKLIELGVEAVEFDVHLTSDGGLAVIHDPTLERTTLGTGTVSAKTLSELQATPLRDSSECIPSLDQVLNVLRGSSLELHIELKTDVTGTAYRGMEVEVLKTVARHGLQQRSILTCFMLEVLEMVRSLDAAIPLLASVDRRSVEMLGGIEEAMQRLDRVPGIYVAIEKALLAHTMEEFAAKFGSDRIGAWVPNDEAELEYWLNQPIRQITTDRPDLAVQGRR